MESPEQREEVVHFEVQMSGHTVLEWSLYAVEIIVLSVGHAAVRMSLKTLG